MEKTFSKTQLNYELKEKLIKQLGLDSNDKGNLKKRNVILRKRTHTGTLKSLLKHPNVAKVYYHFY